MDTKRITIFLIFAFGIAWLTGLVIYLTGGLTGSPVLSSQSGLTLALLLMATTYMWAPALAHVLTRLVTREGWRNVYLRPKLKRGWPFWLLLWFLPGLLIILGAALYYLVFPSHYDPSLSTVTLLFQQRGLPAPANLWGYVLSETIVGLVVSALINLPATFGEEFGWRAYLLPKLMPLGGRKAMLLLGVIWGVWHWPVIFMGYEYGFNYPGYPWLGPLLFLLFTTGVGTLLGWATIRSGSMWPAALGHGATNGMAQIGIFFTQGAPDPLVGPLPVGIIAMLPFLAVAVALLLNRKAMAQPEEAAAEALSERGSLPA